MKIGELNPRTQPAGCHSRLVAIAQALFLLFALASFAYTVVTAPREGGDLASFQDMGRAWATGVYQPREGKFFGPPPFASVLFSPLAVLSFEQWRVIGIAINLLAAGVILFLIRQLWGESWPSKAHLYLAAFLVAMAPFRVTVRYGQISLIVTALLLGALLARRRNLRLLAGMMVGLSLIKYPLTLPFVLYFVWRKEWKIVAAALVTTAVLTGIFALRLGLSLLSVTSDYVRAIRHVSLAHDTHFAGSSEIGPLLFTLTGGNDSLASGLNIALAAAALLMMGLVFSRRPHDENMHFAILTFFSLWFAYHRVYDSVFCILPAAIFVDLIVRKKFTRLANASLAALGLLILSIPGLLTARLHLGESLLRNPAGLLGLHSERLLMIGMFTGLLIFLWRTAPEAIGELKRSNASKASEVHRLTCL